MHNKVTRETMEHKEKDLYVINKQIMAHNAEEALAKEKDANITEVFIDAEWRKHKIDKIISKREDIGF